MRIRSLAFVLCTVLAVVPAARGANQTATVSAVNLDTVLPYALKVQPITLGGAALPTLHSYAAAEHDGKWVLIAGRTNGLHGFENGGSTNFPEESQNREVWVIDPVNNLSWSRSLEDLSSGLTAAQVDSLTPTNNQFSQIGSRLYMTGGYGARSTGGFTTFDTLSAIDLDGITDWVINGTGAAADHIRQVSDNHFKVTGGAMYEMNGRMQIVFGQSFDGGYSPTKVGTYTKQVRGFDIVDDGQTLSFANATSTTPLDEYRRRDLNVFPVLSPDGVGGDEEGLLVLSGVFTPTVGAWTVPVEIDQYGVPTMADPNAPGTFKQAANNYHSAKLGLYSSSQGEMHELLLGGITLQYYDEVSGQFVQDDDFPWTNDMTAVTIDAQGEYSQHYLGKMPLMTDTEGMELRYGANAEFFVAPGVPIFENGVIDFDSLPAGENVVGYVFGGIVSNSPHVRGVPNAVSAATNQVFEIVVEILQGDFNRDGVVDAADYTVWRDGLGVTYAPADYDVWEANYGRNTRSAMTAPGAAVPEPGGLGAALLFTGILGGVRRGRR